MRSSLFRFRVSGAHNLGAKKRADCLKALKAFGISAKDCNAGWVSRWIRSTTLFIVALRGLNQQILTESGLG
jgi:hypothetical protein